MESVKDHNRALIIQLICTNNGVTRQELTEASTLTPMTLTNITSDLIKNNFVCEVDSKNEEKALGRTPKQLYPSPNSPVTAGIMLVLKDFFTRYYHRSFFKYNYPKKSCLFLYRDKKSISDKILSLAEYLINFWSRPL